MNITDRITSDISIDLQDNEINREAASCVECESISRKNDIQYFNTAQEPRPSNPIEWTRDDVALWLRQCNLEQLIHTFQENNIDGLILMNDEFDQSMIKELIPILRDRILFNITRKSLRYKYEKNVNQNSMITQFLYTLNRMIDYIMNETHIFQSISTMSSRYWTTCKRISTQHIVPNIRGFWHNKIIFIIIIMSLFLILFNHHYTPKIRNNQLSLKLNHKKSFDLYDDDGIPLECPSYIRFDLNNRRHFVVMIVSSLKMHIWKNFLGLLCSGIDVYIMLDKKFYINSTSRIDAQPHLQRNSKSYSHRFLFISNETLIENGLGYMNKLPSIQFTAWDRTVAWLYTLSNFSTVWLIEQDVQWYHPNNMTKLFNLFIYLYI